MNKISTIIALIGLFIIAITVGLGIEDRKVVEKEWLTYRSDRYNFEIQYPSDWTYTETNRIEPVINFYKKSENKKPPFIHHDDVANVSIFPFGVPTEGVMGEMRDSVMSFTEQTRVSKDYILSDGKPWASIVYFANNPQSWSNFGFVWARAGVLNEEEKCFVNGIETPIERCGLGDLPEARVAIIRSGTLNEGDRSIEEKMLSSFKFIDMSHATTSSATTSSRAIGTTSIQIALLDPSQTLEGKVVGCDSIVMVERIIPRTETPLNAAYQELFSDKDGWEPWNTVPGNYITSQKNLRFDKAIIENDIAKVYLGGQVGPISGVCDEPRLKSQIEETARQFSTIRGVEVYINETKI